MTDLLIMKDRNVCITVQKVQKVKRCANRSLFKDLLTSTCQVQFSLNYHQHKLSQYISASTQLIGEAILIHSYLRFFLIVLKRHYVHS